MTKVVNFIGGPGCGKSTLATQLFSRMKRQHMDVEYVDEFAKSLTWSGNKEVLDDQIMVFAQQHHNLYMLLGKVEYVITDSPLLLQLFYANNSLKKYKKGYVQDALRNLIRYSYDRYNNSLFYVNRGNKEFVPSGRNENESQAKEIDKEILSYLTYRSYKYTRVNDIDDVWKGLGF